MASSLIGQDMFGDKEGLNTDIKFAVSSIYDGFSNKWDNFDHDKLSWISTWSEVLSSFSVKQINIALQHCIKNINRPPSVFEFRTYCKRAQNNENMNAPYVTRQEEMARRIIKLSNNIGCKDLSELQDACLIAASIAASRSNREVDIEWDEKSVDVHFLPRARMFAFESINWTQEAEANNGYWTDILKVTDK